MSWSGRNNDEPYHTPLEVADHRQRITMNTYQQSGKSRLPM